MPKLITRKEAEALGIPSDVWVIDFGRRARRFAAPRPTMTETERECRYEWAYQAMCDYEDAADEEDDDAEAAYYRGEAEQWTEILQSLGLRYWRRDGSGYWRAMKLYPISDRPG